MEKNQVSGRRHWARSRHQLGVGARCGGLDEEVTSGMEEVADEEEEVSGGEKPA